MYKQSKSSNWGKHPIVNSKITRPQNFDALVAATQKESRFTAKGNSRSYGDAGLSPTMINSLKLKQILSFDEASRLIEVESGLLISELHSFTIGKGYFVPVTPGTQFVSIGGALAADVHGKNHHEEGSFSRHVEEFTLMSDEGPLVCSRNNNAALFWVSIGGMGISGFIYSVKLKLKAIESSYIKENRLHASGLEELMGLFEENKNELYSVAWLDSMSSGNDLGRAVLMLGDHAKSTDLGSSMIKRPLNNPNGITLTVPFNMPSFTLNKWSVSMFNSLYYNTHGSRANAIIPYKPFFYPLDMVLHWNRIYGPNGFTQYQLVVPKESALKAITEVLKTVHDFNEGSFLTTFKLFGKGEVNAPFSFPMEGYTMAMDFRINKNVLNMIEMLDQIVLNYGGRLYLAKDFRMSKNVFERGYDTEQINKLILQSGVGESNMSDQLKRILGR